MADANTTDHEPGYATDLADVGHIAIGGGLIAAAVAASLGIAFWVLHIFAEGELTRGTAAEPGLPPAIANAPRLQPQPERDIAQFSTEKTMLLNSYGWVDREHQWVRMPIERAMQVLAAPDKRVAPQ